MTPKKMGNMTSLSKLSGIKKQPEEQPLSSENTELEVSSLELEQSNSKLPEAKVEQQKTTEPQTQIPAQKRKKKKTQNRLVTVNIKIREKQKRWLADIASQVRSNNSSPVPPAERVYPQHLIGVAIDLLEAAGVDWDEVNNLQELREQLNL